MPIATPRASSAERAARGAIAAIGRELSSILEDRRIRLAQQIRDYPAPIPACDADFNHMLDERSRISEELNALRGLDSKELATREYAARVAEIAASSRCLGDEFRQRIRTVLTTTLASLE